MYPLDINMLLAVKKKFVNPRLVRIIYEYADIRGFWMNEYRYVINKGYNKYFQKFDFYENWGVKTFCLRGHDGNKGLNYKKANVNICTESAV